MKNITLVELFALLSLNNVNNEKQLARRLNFDIFLLAIIIINLSDQGLKIIKKKSEFKLLKKIYLLEEPYYQHFTTHCKDDLIYSNISYFYQNPKITKELENLVFEALVKKKLITKKISEQHGFTTNNYFITEEILDDTIEYFRLEVLEKKYNAKIFAITNIFANLNLLSNYFSENEIKDLTKKNISNEINDLILTTIFEQIKST